MRRLGGAATAAVVLLMVTGCGSQAAGPTSTPTVTVIETPSAPTSSAPSTSASATPSASATSTPAASGGSGASDSGRPADQCADGDIGVTVIPAQDGGAAGSQYFDVLFTNTGGSTCALRGTPGVSVVGDGNGTQLGEPADRLQSGVTTLRLGVGESAAAPLKVVNIRDGGGPIGSDCKVTKGDGYRVYPPHSKKAVFVKNPNAYACTSASIFMTVSPLVRFTG